MATQVLPFESFFSKEGYMIQKFDSIFHLLSSISNKLQICIVTNFPCKAEGLKFAQAILS